jgi:tetratricopeptide (TPR) repeat protein
MSAGGAVKRGGAVEHGGSAERGGGLSAPAATVARTVLVLALVLIAGFQPGVAAIARDYATAQTATTAKNYAAAADALSDAAARLPYSGYAANRAGLGDISAGRFEEAIRQLFAAAALEGWTTARRVALGDAYLGKGDTASAIAQWETALAADPNDDGLLARLANQYEAAGRYTDAVNVLNQLIALRPKDPAVYYRLALLTAATDPDSAPARLALAAGISPSLAPATQVVIDAVQAGQASGDRAALFGKVGYALVQLSEWRLAQEALTHAVTLNPQYSDAFAYLGLALDRQNQDGLPDYETAVKLAPQSPLVQYLLGLHWRRAGDSDTALPYLLAAQKLDANNPAIAAEIGGAYASIGDLPNGELWLSNAVKLDDQNPQWWLLLAKFYTDNQFHMAELGLSAAKRAAALDPKSGPAADVYGYALVLIGDLANGEKALLQALTLGGDSASTYYHLGVLYQMQKRNSEAETALKHALSLDPDGFYGGLALKALGALPPASP